MRLILISLLIGIYSCNSIYIYNGNIYNGNNHYDKYLNRDISTLILRNSEVPFYSSNKLYSSHYMRMNIIDIPNKNNNTNIDIKK